MKRNIRRALRWTVPVDDQWHEIGAGPVLHVDSRSAIQVEVWTLEHLRSDWPTSDVASKRQVRVFGTGHILPDEAAGHLGSVIADPSLVWHLFERAS